MSTSSVQRTNIILVVVSVLLLVGTIAMGYLLFRENKQEETYLRVEEVYFFQKELGDLESSIDIIIMISNTGKADVSKVAVRSFAIETDSNLAQYDASIILNNVKGETTVEGRMSIMVPNGDAYRVELLIFKDDRLTIMGYGNIDLTGVGIVSDYKDVDINAEEGLDDALGGMRIDTAESAGSMGVCLIFMIMAAAFIVLIVIIAVYASKKVHPNEVPNGRDDDRIKIQEHPFYPGPDEEPEEIKRAKPIDMLAEHTEDDHKEEKTEEKEMDKDIKN